MYTVILNRVCMIAGEEPWCSQNIVWNKVAEAATCVHHKLNSVFTLDKGRYNDITIYEFQT